MSQKSKKKKFFQQIKDFLYIIVKIQQFLYKAVGWHLILFYVFVIVGAVLSIAYSYVFARFIDSIIASVSAGYFVKSFWQILGLQALLSLVALLFEGPYNGIIPDWIATVSIERQLDRYLLYYNFKTLKDARLEILEDPKISKEYQLLAKKVTTGTIWRVSFSSIDIITDFLKIFGVVGILLVKFPLLFGVLTLGLLLDTYFVVKQTAESNRFWDVIINAVRRTNRSFWFFSAYLKLLQNKLQGLTNYLLSRYSTQWWLDADMITLRKEYWLKRFTLSRGIRRLVDLFSWVYLARAVLQNKLSIGGVTYYLSLAGQYTGTVSSLISKIASLNAQAYYIKRFFKFWEVTLPKRVYKYKRKTRGIIIKSLKGADIKAENVYYKYKGTTKPALNGINLEIPYGKNIAIVGHNGAGKSTFLKILLSHYINYKGSLTVKGHEVKDYDHNSYLSRFSIINQETITLNFATIYDVITMDKYIRRSANFKLTPDVFNSYRYIGSYKKFKQLTNDAYSGKYKDLWHDVLKNLNFEKVDKKAIEIAKAVGLYEQIKSLPHGFFTYLSTDYSDGVELSAGQWQRLHIARILYDPGDILILDEPTSAIDPLASFKLIDLIFEKFKDRTVIIVSHRYSTIAKADYIYVFDNGKVVEQGTHKELIKKNGYYAKAYKEEIARLQG